MTGIKIDVGADVSGVQSELAKVDAAARRINDALSSGSVGIDVAQAKRDLAQLEEAAKTVADRLARAGGAEVDLVGKAAATSLREAAQAAADLDKVLEAIGQSTGASQVVRSAKEQADHIHRAARAHEVLSREGIKLSRAQVESAKASFDGWRRSGARGTSRIRDTEFDDWVSGGWRSHSIDHREAERRRAEVLRSVGIDQSGTGDQGGRGLAGALHARGGAAAGAAGGILGSMLGGGDGGLWGSVGGAGGAGAGMLAGAAFGGPIGAVVGAFASQLFGGVGRAIDQKMEQAGSEAAIYADLRRSVGVTSAEFEMLRGSVRHFTDGLGLAYNESAQLAKEFARASNARGGDGIGQEVGDAAGFARGFGADPAAAVRMMATMRHLGVTDNEAGSKRLALMIGEAVQRGGTTAKMDEVLSVLHSQASMQARASLSAPDVGAMASFMSSLTGLSMYGMKGDPTNAGAAMSAADAAMRQGGAFGEASKNFSLGLWQRQLSGFTALDMDFMNEQGAFGNIGKAFGRDSAAYKLAESRGDRSKMAQYDQWVGQGGDRSVMAMQMQALEQFYGRDTDEFRKAIQSHFGVGAGQASALYQAYQNDRGLGDLERSLKESGVDVGKLNSKQIAAVAEVAGSDRTGVWKQAERLQSLEGADKLNLADARTLRDAMAGGDEMELRKVVVRLTAAYDSTRDQGEQMRQTQANMANSMQELATKLIPATLAIKDGIVELVRWFAGNSDYVRKHDAEKAAEADQAKKDAALQRTIADKQAAIDNWKPDEGAAQRAATSYAQLKRQRDEAAAAGRDTSGFDHNLRLLEAEIRRNSPEGLSDLTAERDALMRRREASPAASLGAGPVSHGGHSLSPEQRAQLRENDRELGLPPGTLEAQMRVESGFNPNAVSSAGARGYAQLMPKTQAALEKRWSRKIDPSNFDDAARAQKELMAENLRKFGNAQDAMRAYNGGWDPGRWGNPETSAYAGKIERAREEIAATDDRKTPESVRTASGGDFGPQQVSLNVGGRFELYDQQGRELAQPIIQTFFGAPRPAGMFS